MIIRFIVPILPCSVNVSAVKARYNNGMPLFEYVCDNCKKRYTVLVGMTAAQDTQNCPHCGFERGTKRVTRFARGRSEDAQMDDLADPGKIGDMDDPERYASLGKGNGPRDGRRFR